jgi:hypothetical protein
MEIVTSAFRWVLESEPIVESARFAKPTVPDDGMWIVTTALLWLGRSSLQ